MDINKYIEYLYVTGQLDEDDEDEELEKEEEEENNKNDYFSLNRKKF